MNKLIITTFEYNAINGQDSTNQKSFIVEDNAVNCDICGGYHLEVVDFNFLKVTLLLTNKMLGSTQKIELEENQEYSETKEFNDLVVRLEIKLEVVR